MKNKPKFLVPALVATSVTAALATLSWYFGGQRRQPKPLAAATA